MSMEAQIAQAHQVIEDWRTAAKTRSQPPMDSVLPYIDFLVAKKVLHAKRVPFLVEAMRKLISIQEETSQAEQAFVKANADLETLELEQALKISERISVDSVVESTSTAITKLEEEIQVLEDEVFRKKRELAGLQDSLSSSSLVSKTLVSKVPQIEDKRQHLRAIIEEKEHAQLLYDREYSHLCVDFNFVFG